MSGGEARGTRDIFEGPGEMRALCRATSWSATPLGPVEAWSRSLRTTVATVLSSRNPMFLFWGPELVQFYNDAYRPSLGAGGRHPRALGMRGSEFWTDIFGLDGARFSPIESKQYGYDGMLTLFDPPDKLDRIEVVYPHDTEKAMGKFFVKRGEGPYMFFAECDDMEALRERLRSVGARFAPDNDKEAPPSLFVHPSSTHGVLIGISAKNYAWTWSGRPELAKTTA